MTHFLQPFSLLLALSSLLLHICAFESYSSNNNRTSSTIAFHSANRKLLSYAEVQASGVCTKSDLAIIQGSTGTLPNGIPTYTVEISNQCGSECTISNIHLTCGVFSSATVVNPSVFKRLAYNDCLVNNGGPLHYGRVLSFTYASTFSYPLSVASLTC